MDFEDALDAALAQIDNVAYGARLRVVLVIRREGRWWTDGVARIGYRVVARRARVSERYCKTLLDTLVVERVLLRGELGAGTRGTAYRINPRVDQWRGVPWLDDDRERRAYRIATPSRAPDRGANTEAAPRPHGAALGERGPRSDGAAHSAAIIPLAPRSRARRKESVSAATWDRGAAPRPLSSSGANVGNGVENALSQREREVADRIIGAIDARGNGRVNRSATRLRARIEAVAANVDDVDALLGFLSQVDGKLGPPLVVDELESFVAGEHEPPSPAASAPAGGALTKAAKRETLERLIAQYRSVDADPPEDLLAELAACDTEPMEDDDR